MVNTEEKKRKCRQHSWYLRRQIVIEYLQGEKSLIALSEAYGVPNQTISRWVIVYRKELAERTNSNLAVMTAEEQKHYDVLVEQNMRLKKQLELLQHTPELKKENEVLKRELEFSRMKAKAMEVIIDLAKEEYGLDLLKNSGARQSVKLNKTTRRQK